MSRRLPVLLLVSMVSVGCSTTPQASVRSEGESQGLLAASTVGADTESRIKALSETFDKMVAEIDKAPQTKKPKLYDELREQVSAMVFGLAYGPDGIDTNNTSRSDEILVDFVYGVFTADQAHLERAIIHAGGKEEAIGVMPARVRCVASVYPVGSCRDCCERVYFLQYLARAHRYIPDSLPEIVGAQMARWKGDDRVPGLLVLAESGDLSAKTELNSLTSENAEKLKRLFRHIIDLEKKDGQKK